MWGAEETLSRIWGEKSRNNLDIGTVKTEPGDVRNWGTPEQCEEWKAGIFWILALKWHKQGCQELRNTWAELGTGIILLLRPGLGILSSKTAGPRGKSLKEAYDVDQNYLKFPFFFFTPFFASVARSWLRFEFLWGWGSLWSLDLCAAWHSKSCSPFSTSVSPIFCLSHIKEHFQSQECQKGEREGSLGKNQDQIPAISTRIRENKGSVLRETTAP